MTSPIKTDEGSRSREQTPKKTSLFNIFAKEPSSQALEQYEQQIKKQQQASGGKRNVAVGLPMGSGTTVRKLSELDRHELAEVLGLLRTAAALAEQAQADQQEQDGSAARRRYFDIAAGSSPES